MTLLDDLDFDLKAPNIAQRGMQRIASTRPGAWLFSVSLQPVDRLLFDKSKGRITVPGLMAGLPVIMVTTTGAKSGKPRTSPLLGLPVDGSLAVIGSNFGQESTPGWVYNLESNPTATVGYRDRTVDVTARLADDDEADATFVSASSVYGGYAKYRERADHRTIRVFVLDSDSVD
ncbi:MAG: nitroreductase family deazaflavin-dependent oxidoreductase [Acidimicrobiia bacterium]|nr:nitroreductase family deazaflavin-dependent oxidoreductase [Acidimicrobiia bacterium]